MDASASAGPSTQTGGYYMNDGNSQSGSDANGALARYFDTSGAAYKTLPFSAATRDYSNGHRRMAPHEQVDQAEQAIVQNRTWRTHLARIFRWVRPSLCLGRRV